MLIQQGHNAFFPPVNLLEQWTAGTQTGREGGEGKTNSFALAQNKNNYVRN